MPLAWPPPVRGLRRLRRRRAPCRAVRAPAARQPAARPVAPIGAQLARTAAQAAAARAMPEPRGVAHIGAAWSRYRQRLGERDRQRDRSRAKPRACAGLRQRDRCRQMPARREACPVTHCAGSCGTAAGSATGCAQLARTATQAAAARAMPEPRGVAHIGAAWSRYRQRLGERELGAGSARRNDFRKCSKLRAITPLTILACRAILPSSGRGHPGTKEDHHDARNARRHRLAHGTHLRS